ncbi:MAG: hypothetical protein R8G34_19735 [Paracoccaceae bacterium]|nr:hypothetical protein [Paracoccaceae bacterium]
MSDLSSESWSGSKASKFQFRGYFGAAHLRLAGIPGTEFGMFELRFRRFRYMRVSHKNYGVPGPARRAHGDFLSNRDA